MSLLLTYIINYNTYLLYEKFLLQNFFIYEILYYMISEPHFFIYEILFLTWYQNLKFYYFITVLHIQRPLPVCYYNIATIIPMVYPRAFVWQTIITIFSVFNYLAH